MAIFFLYKRKPGVSRYILAIMMINMGLYVSFYLWGKMQLRLRKENWYPSEGIRKITIMYGLFSLLFMMGAVTFFIKELKTSAGTPAESRNLNDSCFLLIFDNHDMWHFLSSSGQKTGGFSFKSNLNFIFRTFLPLHVHPNPGRLQSRSVKKEDSCFLRSPVYVLCTQYIRAIFYRKHVQLFVQIYYLVKGGIRKENMTLMYIF